MPFKKIMQMLGMGSKEEESAAEAEKARKEEERRREEEQKKKRKNVFKPHGREQMTDEEFEDLEKASR